MCASSFLVRAYCLTACARAHAHSLEGTLFRYIMTYLVCAISTE